MKCASYTAEVREKKSSLISKLHTFSTILNIPQRRYQFTPCLFEDVTEYRDYRRIKLKSFLLISLFVFYTK